MTYQTGTVTKMIHKYFTMLFLLKQYNEKYYIQNKIYNRKRKVLNQPIATISIGTFIVELENN